MTDVADELVRSILEDGLDDHIHLAWLEMRAVEMLGTSAASDAVIELSLVALRRLLERRWMVIGDAVWADEDPPYPHGIRRYDIRPWDVTTERALERVRREWERIGRRLLTGEIAWLEITNAGEAVARGAHNPPGSSSP